MRQNHIGFGDAADAAMQHLGADFGRAEFFNRAVDGFERALHIGLDDQRQQPLLAFFTALEQLIERLTRDRRLPRFAPLAAAIFRDFAGAGFRVYDDEFVAGFRRAGEAQNFDGGGGTRFLNGFATIVDERTYAAPFGAGHEQVAMMKRAALHQHGCYRATPLVELGFDHRPVSRAL